MSNEQEQPRIPEDYTLDLDDAIEEMLAPKDEPPGDAYLRRFMAKCHKRDERIKAALLAGEKVRPEDEEESQRELDEHARAEAILEEERRGRELLKEWNEKKKLAARAKLGLPPLEDVKAAEAVSPFPWGRVILLAVLLLVLESGAIAGACYWGEGKNALQKIGACWWLLTSVFAIIVLIAPFTLGKATWVRVKRWWNSARGEAQ